MESYETTLDLDTPLGLLEGVPATFLLDIETWPAGLAISARLQQIKLQGLTLGADEIASWLGPEEVQRFETFIEENYDDDEQ